MQPKLAYCNKTETFIFYINTKPRKHFRHSLFLIGVSLDCHSLYSRFSFIATSHNQFVWKKFLKDAQKFFKRSHQAQICWSLVKQRPIMYTNIFLIVLICILCKIKPSYHWISFWCDTFLCVQEELPLSQHTCEPTIYEVKINAEFEIFCWS